MTRARRSLLLGVLACELIASAAHAQSAAPVPAEPAVTSPPTETVPPAEPVPLVPPQQPAAFVQPAAAEAPAPSGPSAAARPNPLQLPPQPEPPPSPEEPESELTLRPKARVMAGFEVQREHPSSVQGGADSTDYGMFLDQARVGLEAELDRWELDISADLADAMRPVVGSNTDRPPYIRNAYLNLRLDKAFRVRAGRFKRPFSGLELTSSGNLPFRDRGLSNGLIVEDAQWGDRALGLMLWGRLPGKLKWHVAAMSPTWAPDGDLESNGIDVLARLEWEASDGFELGLSGGHKLEVRRGQELNTNAVSADVRVASGKLTLMLDAQLAQLSHLAAAGMTAPIAYGVVLYGAYGIPVTEQLDLEPVLFFEYADADSEFSGTEAVRVVAGLNVVLSEHFRVMPQIELVRSLETASALSPWSNRETYYVMLLAQL